VLVGVPAAGGDAALPAGPWATTVRVGPYPQLPLAYTALLQYVRAPGHRPAGPVTETYLTDPSTAEPDELVTRLAVALEPDGP
jgi:effector-binding domain-containing protein